MLSRLSSFHLPRSSLHLLSKQRARTLWTATTDNHADLSTALTNSLKHLPTSTTPSATTKNVALILASRSYDGSQLLKLPSLIPASIRASTTIVAAVVNRVPTETGHGVSAMTWNNAAASSESESESESKSESVSVAPFVLHGSAYKRKRLKEKSVGRWARQKDIEERTLLDTADAWETFKSISISRNQVQLPQAVAGHMEAHLRQQQQQGQQGQQQQSLEQQVLVLSDPEVHQFLDALDDALPQARKAGLVVTSTPFITGEMHSMFYDDQLTLSTKLLPPPLEILSQPMAIARCRGNIILGLDAQDLNPTRALLDHLEGRNLQKTDEFYIATGPVKPDGQEIDMSAKETKLFKITGGDPSKGNMAVDTVHDLQNGQWIQFMTRKRNAATDKLLSPLSPCTLGNTQAVFQVDEIMIEDVLDNAGTKHKTTQGIFGGSSENGIIMGLPDDFTWVPTSPESETNTIAAATKTAAKDVFDILPPEIIDHVLSFMSIPTLFKCSVLSRRWSRRVLPKLWHAPFMIYYVSWMKLLQHLSTCPLPLRERGETADGRCSDDTRPAPQDSSNNHRPTAAITDFSLLLPPLLSPDKSPPLAHRRLSSQFTSSSCWSSTTSYLYRFPTLDRLSTSPPSHQHPRASFSPSHSAHRTASWKTYHHPTGRRRRRRSSYDDAEQQEQMLAAILGGVPRYAHYIRILDFSQLHYIVSDRLLTSLIPHTPFLTELIVEEPKQLSDDSLISIAASSTMLRHHLKRLELHHCRRITDRGLSAIVQHCTQLDTVRLSGGTPVTDRIINMMAHLLAPTLRRVDFSNAALVTSSDPGLMTLAIWCQRDPASTSASQMDDPLSTRSSPTTIPPAISSSSPLLPTMPTAAGLVDCRFSGCQGITDSLIARLANLEVLHVAHCYEVTDQAMMSVAARSPDLVELDITACWAITDRGILAVGRGCPKLRRLILEEPFDVEQVEREGEQEEEEEEEEEEGPRTKTALYISSGYVNFKSFQTTNQFYKLDLSVPWKSTSPAWHRLANGPNGAHIPGAFSQDEKTMVVFQSFAPSVSTSALAWFYSVDQDRWVTDDSIQVPVPDRQGITAITVPASNLVYLPRGYLTDDVQSMGVYDFGRKTLGSIPIEDPSNAFYGRAYHSGVWSQHLQAIVFFGGYGPWGAADNATAFDPAKNTYTTLLTSGPKPTPRADHCAAISDDGKLMVIYGGRPVTGSIYILNLQTMQWKQGRDGEARIYQACALAGSNQLITWGGADGVNTVGMNAATLPARIYNIDTDQWVDNYTPPASYLSANPQNPNPNPNPNPNNNNTNTDNSRDEDDDNKSSNMGLILGVSLGAAALLAAGIIGFFVVRRRRRRADSKGSKAAKASTPGDDGRSQEKDDGATTATLLQPLPVVVPGQQPQEYEQYDVKGDAHLYHHSMQHSMVAGTTPPPTFAPSPITSGYEYGHQQQQQQQQQYLLHQPASMVTTTTATTMAMPATVVNAPHTQPAPAEFFQPVYSVPHSAGYSPLLDAAYSPHSIASSSPSSSTWGGTTTMIGSPAAQQQQQQLAMPPFSQPGSQQAQQVSVVATAGQIFEPSVVGKDPQMMTTATGANGSYPAYAYYDASVRPNNPQAILD
ncbi:hypothetical protein DFQ27_007236 [Actinomortierella ambigua]|uniref:F-box domain-containing protein n=1 Tax=Actinomortierella ambigua TaxID=1343610 RepID=A0A9P6PTJ3_9FUNG|nr:hypothetical protein DFQ27_007236 [Actinomortierella ambigua]